MSLKRAVFVIATIVCMNAAARSSQAVVGWMDESTPFDAASIRRHFGDALGAIQCADDLQGRECIADGERVALRWRLNGDNREFHDGFLRMELEGCKRKMDIEQVFGTTLRLEPQGVTREIVGRKTLRTPLVAKEGVGHRRSVRREVRHLPDDRGTAFLTPVQ